MVVLNAFRHQRKELWEFRERLGPGIQVLNAFRHQRKELAKRAEITLQWLKCSTPFGINGRNSPARRNRKADKGIVLNAFRHQRKELCRE